MNRRVIYLDNNATTRALPEVRDAVARTLDDGFGNPSSAHSTGEQARRALARARRSVADLIGAPAENVFFTSSGTEANNTVLCSVGAKSGKTACVVTSSIEHSSILKCCEHLRSADIEVVELAPTGAGWLDPAAVREMVMRRRPTLVSLQWVNNETGVIQPLAEIARICREYEVPLHTDAAQAVGKLAVDVGTLDLDYLTFTAHKFHGPPGVGVVYARQPTTLRPLLYGGDQERGLRPGTENFPGIVGAGVAAGLRTARLPALAPRLAALRDEFEQHLIETLSGVTVNGERMQRVCNTTNLRFGTLDGQALMARLDAVNVRCSQSSACTSARPEPSHVLRAMGLSEDEAYASVRFSFSELNSPDEVAEATARIEEVVEQLTSVFA